MSPSALPNLKRNKFEKLSLILLKEIFAEIPHMIIKYSTPHKKFDISQNNHFDFNTIFEFKKYITSKFQDCIQVFSIEVAHTCSDKRPTNKQSGIHAERHSKLKGQLLVGLRFTF